VVVLPGQKAVSFSPDTRRDAGRYTRSRMSEFAGPAGHVIVPVANPGAASARNAPRRKLRAVGNVRRLIGVCACRAANPVTGAQVAVVTSRSRPVLGHARLYLPSPRPRF